MMKFTQVRAVAGVDRLVKRPLMGDLFSGFPVASPAGILREPPNQIVLHRAFCFGTPDAYLRCRKMRDDRARSEYRDWWASAWNTGQQGGEASTLRTKGWRVSGSLENG
jgi:hypothetical protein